MNEDRNNNAKSRGWIWLLVLHIALLIYSCTGLFSKNAVKYPPMSMPFLLFYGGMIAILGVYALIWQQVIKHLPVTFAYANKAVTVVWGVVLGRVVFGESITLMQLAACLVIVAGTVLYVTWADDSKKGGDKEDAGKIESIQRSGIEKDTTGIKEASIKEAGSRMKDGKDRGLLPLLKELFFKCYGNRVLRYIFFGGLTTLVNLVVYYCLRGLFKMPVTPANIVSIASAIVFAYFVNSRFVFESSAGTFSERLKEFAKFAGARLSTMVIEVAGVWFISDVLKKSDYIGKFVIQFIILALNYVFSKFLVFKKR